MHKVFISYHHGNDQSFKEQLQLFNLRNNIFIDRSVDTGDINENLPNQRIREIIRDDYLSDSTVTIVLVGTETKNRKHLDWEIYSSMIDGRVNKRSGILVITLPTTGCIYYTAAHDGEKERVYPVTTNWVTINTRTEYERRYPYLPARIIDNLLNENAKISVTNWDKIINSPFSLTFLIEAAHKDKQICKYDLSRPMRRANA